jgi:hypothetical protein
MIFENVCTLCKEIPEEVFAFKGQIKLKTVLRLAGLIQYEKFSYPAGTTGELPIVFPLVK